MMSNKGVIVWVAEIGRKAEMFALPNGSTVGDALRAFGPSNAKVKTMLSRNCAKTTKSSRLDHGDVILRLPALK